MTIRTKILASGCMRHSLPPPTAPINRMSEYNEKEHGTIAEYKTLQIVVIFNKPLLLSFTAAKEAIVII